MFYSTASLLIIIVLRNSRENELLKHQLKKYVGAVQMLRRQGASQDGNYDCGRQIA